MNWINTDGDYYVSKIYGSDYNDGSITYPFKTIVKGLTTIGMTTKVDGSPKKLVIEGGIVYNENISSIRRAAVDFIWDGERGIIDPLATNFIFNKNGDIIRNLFVYKNQNNIIYIPDTSGYIVSLYNCFLSQVTMYSALYNNVNGNLYTYNSIFLNVSLVAESIGGFIWNGYNNIIINLMIDDKYSDSGYLSTYPQRLAMYNTYFNVMPAVFKLNLSNPLNSILTPPNGLLLLNSFSYNALPSSWVAADMYNHHINTNINGFDAKFVNESTNNYNVHIGSSLLNAGIPDAYTGRPSNIGCVIAVDSYSGSDTPFTELGGAVYENTTIDTDGSITITAGSKNASIISGVINLGSKKLITDIDVNKLVYFFSDGKYQQLVDYKKSYNRGIVVAADSIHLTLESLKSQSDNDYYNSMIVKLISGTGKSFTITGDTNSDTSITNISNVNNLYKGQSISGNGIPSNTYISDISGNTLTLSNSVSGTNAGITLTLLEPIRNITAYNSTTKICTIDNAWNTIPDTTTTYEIYEVGKCGCDIGIRWTDTEIDLETSPWSWMQLNSAMFFSDQVNRYGTADSLYNPAIKDYIRGRYFQVKLKLTDLS